MHGWKLFHLKFVFYVYVCAWVCVFAVFVSSSLWKSEEALDFLELELQTVVSCPVLYKNSNCS